MNKSAGPSSSQLISKKRAEKQKLQNSAEYLTVHHIKEISRRWNKEITSDPDLFMYKLANQQSHNLRTLRIKRNLTLAEVSEKSGLPEEEILRAEFADMRTIPLTFWYLDLFYQNRQDQLWSKALASMLEKIKNELEINARDEEKEKTTRLELEEKLKRKKEQKLKRRLKTLDYDVMIEPITKVIDEAVEKVKNQKKEESE